MNAHAKYRVEPAEQVRARRVREQAVLQYMLFQQVATEPPIVNKDELDEHLSAFLAHQRYLPYLLVEGDAGSCLRHFPAGSIDMVITSPPYWSQREYGSPNSIGGEASIQDYVASLLNIFAEVNRVLKLTGSFWLNIGDAYRDKNLCGVPWRVAIALQDQQGWILRNDVVWNKLKGSPDNAKDKVRNVHEYIFHFVKQRDYFYDDGAVRKSPGTASIRNGSVVTATGVSGVNYRRQIQRSTSLSEEEKSQALLVLDETLRKVARGELFDFRMVIRGQQRATHSDSTKVSGRASELEKKGFYILPYDRKGSKIGDVWDIIPEDQWRKDAHYAPFPEELCRIPIQATCPLNGVVLDPFAGTGTAVVAATRLQRRAIGIDTSKDYLQTATSRLQGR